MKIKLLSLELKNFKGIKNRLLNFGDNTEIEGENGIGKTTIFDAFCWLYFGKDSTDRKDFKIQPQDAQGNTIHHLDTIVTGTLEVDGVIKIFKRTLKEKWQKQKGAAEKELNGTTTEYEINDVPVKQKEYLEKIADILNENNFKLLSNPLYFPNMEWKKQREILFDIIGNIDQESVINYNEKLKPLNELLQGKTIEEFTESIKASITKLKNNLKDIPARIDENNSNICTEDFTELEKEKIEIKNKIDTIDSQLTDLSKANEGKLKLQEQLFELKEQLSNLRLEASKNANKPLEEIQSKINSIKSEIQENNFKIQTTERNINNFNNTNLEQEKVIENLKVKKQNLLNNYHSIEERIFEFDENTTICKCCGRAYDMEKIEEIKNTAESNFISQKNNNIQEVIAEGKKIANSIEKAELLLIKDKEEVNKLNDEVLVLDNKTTELEQELKFLEYKKQKIDCVETVIEGEAELLIKISNVEAEINNFKTNDNTLILEQKKGLQEQLNAIERTLGKQDTNKDIKVRIEELLQEEKDLNIQIAKLEKQQFLCEEFTRTKVELLESTISNKFGGEVQFRLFDEQVKGGLSDTCKVLINGVPFTDANKAAKINTGISILNTLSKHYNTSVPVFVDNSESVNYIQHTDSQLITLRVSKNKELKVEVM